MARKKISELTALESASLDTVVVGVDNGVTYKIELDTLADGVANRINTLDIQRLNALENYTASFTVSVDFSDLNSFTQSQDATNTSFTNAISGRLTTASFNEYTTSISTASLIDRLNTIESTTSSYLISLDGVISSSSQLTSSFDERYILSGSLTAGSNVSVSDTAPNSPTEGDLWWKSDDGNLYVYYDSYWVVATDTISAIPNGVISGSAQITTLGFVSGSYETTGRGIISGSSQLTTSFPSKTIGTWTLPTGASIQSFTVEAGHTYSMWVNGNIPNGIITWNATATLSNTNVPVVGSQFGWYYVDGNALVLTSIPDQIIGTNGGIITSPSSYPPNTSNVFKFGITNNSGTTQTINYGYIKLS